MRRSAVEVLSVFDLDEPQPAPVDILPEPPEIEPLGYSIAEELDRRVAEAVTAARAEEQKDAEWRLTEALAEQARQLQAAQQEARLAWVEEQSDRISTAFDKSFVEIRDRLSLAASRALRPILERHVVERSLAELALGLEQMMTCQSAPVFKASGPPDLLDRLVGKLGPRAAAVVFEPDDTADVCVVSGETVIETRLRDWAKCLDLTEEQTS